MRLAICSLFVAAMVGGCAVPQTTQAPTHRWSSAAADQVQYRNDHARCQALADSSEANQYDPTSDTFDSYKSCMENKGYELTAYTGHE